MRIGLFTDSLRDRPLDQVLRDAAQLGITDIELGTGNWSPSPHVDLDRLLTDESARADLLASLGEYDMRLSALNASGNILHPASGRAHLAVLEKSIMLAGLLKVPTVVAMSGLPAAPGDRTPNWITTAWPPENYAILEWQWGEALPVWRGLHGLAAEAGVSTLALELHPAQLVYNVRTFRRLRDAVGERITVNLDPSHLMWLGADPLEVIDDLATVDHGIGHVHAKDTAVLPESAINTALETLPFERTSERAWNYVTLGRGHPDGLRFWAEFVCRLRDAGYDGVLSIEHEDEALPRLDGVRESVEILDAALASIASTTKP